MRILTPRNAGYALAAAAILGFLGLAGEMTEGETLPFDRAIMLALHNADGSPIGPAWLAEMARDVTALGGTAILTGVTLAAVGYLALLRKGGAALLVLVSIGGGTLLGSLLKLAYDRPRPDLVPHGVAVYSASFPSGHAMLSAITWLTLGVLLAQIEAPWRVRGYIVTIAVLITLLVGASRIYLGVHWPTDVLAGWCIGGAWALLCWLVSLRLTRRA